MFAQIPCALVFVPLESHCSDKLSVRKLSVIIGITPSRMVVCDSACFNSFQWLGGRAMVARPVKLRPAGFPRRIAAVSLKLVLIAPLQGMSSFSATKYARSFAIGQAQRREVLGRAIL